MMVQLAEASEQLPDTAAACQITEPQYNERLRIAEGSFGTVYMVIRVTDFVALKCFRLTQNDRIRDIKVQYFNLSISFSLADHS